MDSGMARAEVQLHDKGFTPSVEASASIAMGAAGVAAGTAIQLFAYWVTKSYRWVLWLLLTKPLVDLAWRWTFVETAYQVINLQAVVGIAALILNGTAVLFKPLDKRLPRSVLIFLFCATASVVFSPSSEGLNEILRLLAGAMFFYTAGPLLADRIRFARYAKALLLVGAIPVVLTYFQAAGILPFDYFDWIDHAALGRGSGTYPTPLNLVYLLIYMVPLGLYLTCKEIHTAAVRWMAWLFLAAAFVALAFTYHRAGYIAVALQVLLWFYLSRGRRSAAALFLALALLAAISSERLGTLFDRTVISGVGEVDEHFLRGRGFQWILFLQSYYSSGPIHWLIGNGGSIIAGLDPLDAEIDANEPHSDYIRILHAYGLVGFGLYVSMLFQFFRKAIRRLGDPDAFPRAVARIVLVVLVAVVLLSITTEPMRYPSAVWYLFALVSALYCVERPSEPVREAAGA